jgi:flagellar hook-associated protein 3 FlgL
MRVSSLMIYEQLKKAIQADIDEVTENNLRLATGKKINKPSDDPVGAIRAIDYKVNISQNDQFQRNIAQAGIFLDTTDKTITSAQDSIGELRKMLSLGMNKMDPSDRDFYSRQAAGYRDFLLNLSNTRLGERHIFAGYHTDQQAFTFNAATHHFDYNGDLGQIKAPVDRGATTQMNIQGSKVFSVTMSTPTPTALADGTPIAFTQATDPATGVNTITIEIGNAGDPVHDAFTVSNVMDIANYMSSAWQQQDVDGTALDASASVSVQKATHRLEALFAPLNAASTQMLQVQSEIGTREIFLNDQKARHDLHNLNLENARAKTEDADINETVVDIKKAEVALEALRSSSANILSRSLFDFLN